MCGIYGLLDYFDAEAPMGTILERMAGVIAHRGPDDHGAYTGRGIGLGMRRLSIIDVAGGHQPICNEDGTVWIVMNGEIYNFRQLRSEVEKKGHTFRTRTDTEVLVHLYEQEGTAFVKRLRGMFALALWDERQERLLLARDRIGEKPLYVRRETGRLLFASELKSILQVPNIPRRLNFQALQEYLALGYVPAPLTLLEGIEKLLPGHYWVIDRAKVEDVEYWDIPRNSFENRSEQEWIEGLQAKLLETIESQLVSDVPLGAFLSGGIDSSTIVAAMARVTGRPVKTYSIGYEGKHSYYNELPYAKIVAQAYGTDHHEIIVRPEMSELLPKLVWHLDEPIADSACLTTYLVSKLARESVTVILSGVGGDELFGGYRRYLGNSVHRWYRLLPRVVREQLIPALLRKVPQDRGAVWKDYSRYAAAFVKTSDLDPADRYMSYVTLLSAAVQDELLQGKGQSNGSGPTATLRHHFAVTAGHDSLSRIIYADLKTSLPDDLLALTDRMSMAASVECRAPLVDFELIEFASRMPSSYKVRGMTMKHLLKKAVAPWLPREVIHRKKRGFGAPVGTWIRDDLQHLVDEMLSEDQINRRGLFHWRAIEAILTAHREQRSDHTDHIFALIMFETWCRVFLDDRDLGASKPLTGRAYSEVRSPAGSEGA